MTSTERLKKEVERLRQENNQANQDCRKWIEQAATQRVRAEKAEAVVDEKNKLISRFNVIYERRHRKWALKRAKGGLLLQNGIYVLSDSWEKRAHKAEGEVAGWKAMCEQETVVGNRWKDHADRLLARAEKAEARVEKLTHLLED